MDDHLQPKWSSAVRETPKRGKTLQLLIHLLECTQTFWSKSKGSSPFANSIDRFLTCLAPYLRKGWMRIIWQRSILIQVKRESKLTYIIGVNGESNIVLTEWIEILTFCMHDCWLRSLPKETPICTLSPPLIPSEDIYNEYIHKETKTTI